MEKDRIDLKDYTANLNADIPARTCVAFITTSTIDEEGEVVLPSGIQTTRFKQTGTVFGITTMPTLLQLVNGLN